MLGNAIARPLLVALALLTIAGCAASRHEIALELSAATTAAVADRGTIAILGITDDRSFENNPRSPATPSVDGDVDSLDPATKARVIGRQRNSYGAARGDIVLAGDDSVPARVRALLEQGLQQRGYRLVADASSAASTLSLDVREFWAWFSPGMSTVSFEARTRSGLLLRRGDVEKRIEVTGHGLNRGQVASDANWQLAYARAFEDFLRDLDKELGEAGW